tara:strand:- start:193 stop:384 length:192 start_codon:yes stop_codon:yes gene_type:complete
MKPILLLAAFSAQAALLMVKVVGVSDGDTITVLAEGNKQSKIAVSLANARRSHTPCKQCSPPR